jgi:hypothetical protein
MVTHLDIQKLLTEFWEIVHKVLRRRRNLNDGTLSIHVYVYRRGVVVRPR